MDKTNCGSLMELLSRSGSSSGIHWASWAGVQNSHSWLTAARSLGVSNGGSTCMAFSCRPELSISLCRFEASALMRMCSSARMATTGIGSSSHRNSGGSCLWWPASLVTRAQQKQAQAKAWPRNQQKSNIR